MVTGGLALMAPKMAAGWQRGDVGGLDPWALERVRSQSFPGLIGSLVSVTLAFTGGVIMSGGVAR